VRRRCAKTERGQAISNEIEQEQIQTHAKQAGPGAACLCLRAVQHIGLRDISWAATVIRWRSDSP
jgi:hypothetical protein